MSDELINQDELDALFNLEGSDEEAAKPDVHESKLQKFLAKSKDESPQEQNDGLVSQDDLDSLFNLDDDEDKQKDSEQKDSGGGDMLSQDDLDALLNGDSPEDSAPASPSDSSESSDSTGGDLVSQDDLDSLFNLDDEDKQNDSEQKDSGGGDMLSQDDLDALLNGDPAEDEKAVRPAEVSQSDDSGGGDILDQDELDALFSGGAVEEPAKEEKPPKPAIKETPAPPQKPAPAPKPEGIVIPEGGDILDQDELDALFSGGVAEEPAKEEKPPKPAVKEKPAPAPKPAPKPEGIVIPEGGDILDQDELDALFSGGASSSEETNAPSAAPALPGSGGDDILTQDDLDGLFNLDDEKPAKAVEPMKAPAEDDGELISQDELDMLLGGMSSSSDKGSAAEVKEASPPPVQQSKPADSKPKVLSQAEIDNMFAGLNLDDDEEEDEPAAGRESVDSGRSVSSASTAAADYADTAPSSFYDSGGQSLAQKQYKLYNFRRPEKLSRDQIRLMKPHFEPMTRSVTNYLSMQLKTSIDTNFLDIDQINYGDIFRKLDQSDIIGIFKLYPTPHSGILEFSTFLFYSIEERMMGGSGKSHTPIRKITDFEKYLVTDLFENFLSAYGDTIRKFVDTNPRVDMVETDKFLIPRTLSDEEVLVRMVYEIYIDGVSGLLKINIPYSFLSTFFSPFRNKQDPTSEKIDSKSVSRNIFSKISVPVSVELKPRKLSVGDLMSLRRGDTIILSHAYGEELGLKVDNNLKYYCRPGISGNKLAVKITRTAEGQEL